jgi:hypothetical protein
MSAAAGRGRGFFSVRTEGLLIALGTAVERPILTERAEPALGLDNSFGISRFAVFFHGLGTRGEGSRPLVCHIAHLAAIKIAVIQGRVRRSARSTS